MWQRRVRARKTKQIKGGYSTAPRLLPIYSLRCERRSGPSGTLFIGHFGGRRRSRLMKANGGPDCVVAAEDSAARASVGARGQPGSRSGSRKPPPRPDGTLASLFSRRATRRAKLPTQLHSYYPLPKRGPSIARWATVRLRPSRRAACY